MTVARACALHERAMALRDAGKPAAARRASAKAVALFEAHEGPKHPDVANALVESAGAAHDVGDFAEALASARRALAILARQSGDIDLERVRAAAQGQVAQTLLAQGKYALAEKAALRALAIAKAKLPRAERPTHLNGLAVVYKYLERYAEAARLYRAALAILEPAYGPRSVVLAPILHNLGGLAHARGRFAEGVPFARRGLAIRRRASGPDHPDTAADAAALAAILHGAGKLTEAERLFRDAIRVYERAYGKDHFEVGFNLGNLAALCQAEKRWPEALDLYARSLRIKQKALGRSHPDVALTLQNHAVLHHEMGNRRAATAGAKKALAMFIRTVGPRHPLTKESARVASTIQSSYGPRAAG